MSDQVSHKDLSALLNLGLNKLQKEAATPTEEIAPAAAAAGGPPMDPAAAAGGAPMDPAMAAAGGAPPPVDPATGMPMDPAMMAGGMPMDPAMMAPQGEDPLVELLMSMSKKIDQTLTLVATIADQTGVKVPTNELLEAGEDPLDEAMSGGGGGEKMAAFNQQSDGVPASFPEGAMYATHNDPREPSTPNITADNDIRAAALWAAELENMRR